MSSWRLIFLQSKANDGLYDETRLPTQNWDWPEGTWFQNRLRYLRKVRPQTLHRSDNHTSVLINGGSRWIASDVQVG